MPLKRKLRRALEKRSDPNIGQGFNDARGDFPDHYSVPKNNGLNVNNDPAHQERKARRKAFEKGRTAR